MPIYDISHSKDAPQAEAVQVEPQVSKKDRFFSSLTARLLFFVLFLGDVVWLGYTLCLFTVFFVANLVTFFRFKACQSVLRKKWIALKRSSVCAVALVVALFSPALGIMVACTYFLMYDKTGIQEVVPSSLEEQFKEFMR
ncbi:MAG: hypothetical protein LVR00_03785 [Rhabdochlamydiaceae bacterium]|jgi:hypothetical protein